ncbi:MAG: hypothetical protein QGF00_08410 [Planctomycetota bacterium]|jgi:hypothetical protein|nr:hypothetical protein [Planctomycetota bacterium]
MDVEEIRKTLGSKAENMTDEQVIEVGDFCRQMARLAVDTFIESKRNERLAERTKRDGPGPESAPTVSEE